MPGLNDMFSSGLGLFGALFNANQARHTADEFRGFGDLYRSQLGAMTNDPDIYFKGPIAKALANASDRRYSSVFGNPAGSGTAQALSLEAMLQGYGQERDRLFKMGGGEYWNRAYPGARLGQNKAYSNVFGSLQDLLGGFGGGGGGGGGGGADDLMGF